MSDEKKNWGITNNLMTIIALLATVFSCVLALLAFTAPQQVARVIFQISGTTPEPEVIVITTEPIKAPVNTLESPTATPSLITSTISESNQTFEELPITYKGSFDQYNYKMYEMVFHIEQIRGNEFSGKLHWPSLRNSITQVEGEFVEDFGDILQQSKWSYIEDFDIDKNGIWMMFTETQILQGSNIETSNLYLARLRDDGTMEGVYFSNNQRSQPGGDFTIFYSP